MSVINAVPLLAAAGGDYTISRSVRLRSSASAYFNRTPAGAGTSNKTFTYSAWVKRGALGSIQNLISSPNTGNSDSLRFSAADKLEYNWQDTVVGQVTTTQVFRDSSAWYHIMFAMDTTQATASNRFKLYVNGVQVTAFATASYPAQNTVVNNTAAVATKLGQYANASSQNFDGYLTEVNFIDGQALDPTSFGETDTITGVWKPKKYAGTYGTNGFYLNFSDNSNNTAATIGKDSSGNGNNWTPNNISITAGTTYDSMLDVPTPYADGNSGRGNYAVINPLAVTAASSTITNGNLQVVTPNVGGNAFATMGIPASGKWYFEVTPTSGAGNAYIGVSAYTVASSYLWQNSNHVFYVGGSGSKSVDGSSSAYGASYTDNDVIGVACDSDAGTITFYKNNASQGSISHTMTDMFPALTDGASASGVTYQTNFGQRPFTYTPPSGFKALNTQNLPSPTISNGANYMNVALWSGASTGTQIDVTSYAFQPDLIWSKTRNNAYDHYLQDAVRGIGVGATNTLSSNLTSAETNTSGLATAFLSNGFRIGSSALSTSSGNSLVTWGWKESATAGFDIVTYTGTGANRTIAHSLGVAPSMIIVKSRSINPSAWSVYTSMTGAGNELLLNSTAASAASSNTWNSTAPTSTVFSVGTAASTNQNSATYVAYLFAEVAGFSKFGSYTGNGSSDGPFVYTGFRPRFVLIKETGNANSWELLDTSRNPYNAADLRLFPNDSLAEATTANTLDILSNGFKPRVGNTGVNRSGGTYIYAAFAENPFRYALAR